MGCKSWLFCNRVVFNAALFKSDFKDFQAQQRISDPLDASRSYYTTTNAGSLETKGVEADLTVRVAPGFTLSGNVAYIPTKFTDYAIQCKTGITNPGTSDGQCTYVHEGSPRSEEHTSELQSLMPISYAVFCLKKKKIIKKHKTH